MESKLQLLGKEYRINMKENTNIINNFIQIERHDMLPNVLP